MNMQNYHSLLDTPESKRFETYSYLEPMDAAQLRKQIQAIVDKNWQVAIEHVEPARANSTYWYMWKLPMFGEWDVDVILNELNQCRNTYPEHVIKLIGYNPIKQSQGMAMVVSQPKKA